MLPIRYLTIHCAATPEGRDVKAKTVDDWDRAKAAHALRHARMALRERVDAYDLEMMGIAA